MANPPAKMLYLLNMNEADYTNSLTNLANSILKQFGVEPFHKTLKTVDDYIRDKTKILLFLFDGMGKSLIEKHLPEDSFLRTHILTTITSTLPPTTAAATNSLLSGKYPIETGWLGWSQYFEEYKANIDVFPNTYSASGRTVSIDNVMRKVGAYKTLATLINEKFGKTVAYERFGYPVDKFSRENFWLRTFIMSAYKRAHNDNIDEQSFVYAYWTKPDSLLHKYGTNHPKVHRYLEKIDHLIERYSRKNPDVTTLVIADHGFTDVSWLDLAEHPELTAMLRHPISLEPRCSTFFVKKEDLTKFKETFNQYYGDYFELLSKKEVLERQLFGPARPTKRALSFIGDYVAFATDRYCFYDSSYKKKTLHQGHHAGTTLDELEVSLIAIN